MSVAGEIRARLARFTYKADRGEEWRSLADLVRQGKDWADDCDGYALTAAQLAVEDFALPRADVALAMCRTETGGGHLVCLVTEGGTTRAIDNRQSAAWEWSTLPYRWISAMRLAEPGVWRTIEGAG